MTSPSGKIAQVELFARAYQAILGYKKLANEVGDATGLIISRKFGGFTGLKESERLRMETGLAELAKLGTDLNSTALNVRAMLITK